MGIFGREPEGKPPEPPLAPPARAASTPPADKDKDKDNKAAASAAVPAKPGTCIIGAKTVIKGEITGDEDVVVDGTVEGQIRITRDLRVGAGGVVKATIEAQSIIVSGELVGDCQATVRVEIQSTGKLTGNIRAPKIVIAEGAMFRGNSDMSARKDDKKVASL
jgi:cytoskeletal protein CcmA (bactofilin family)